MVTMKRLQPLRSTLVVQDRGPQVGIVLAVGPDVRTPELTAGTLIAYPDTAGCVIDLGNYAGRLMDEAEVRAVIEYTEVEDEDEVSLPATTPKAWPAARQRRQPLASSMVQ